MAETNGPTSTVAASLMLHGRVAIVTGGAGGIGSAVSKHLASLGARVVVAYFGDSAPAKELVCGINTTHGADPPRALAVKADVSDAAQVRALFDVATEAFGGELHILVTTAAVLDFSYPPLAETSEATYDAMFGTNAPFLCCHEAANRLARDGPHRDVLVVGCRVAASRVRRVRGEQGGGGGDDEDPGAGAAWHGDHRQRGGAGVHGHAHVLQRQDAGGGGAVQRRGAAGAARYARGYRPARRLPCERRWRVGQRSGPALQWWHHLVTVLHVFFYSV
ncbi:unnamed protein product [Alopecurus aequalis]